MIFDAIELIRHRFSVDYFMRGGIFYNAFGSLVVAPGHLGLLMLIAQSGALGWLTTRLAAVGRMALSNYLFDSLVCRTLFYGYGFGFDVALFWNSPRRGRTNQPRATPGEWEFPQKTSPEGAQQGVGDVAPLRARANALQWSPGDARG